MFIQSNFRDYYDSVARTLGRDPKVVYARKTGFRTNKQFPETVVSEFLRSSRLLRGDDKSHYVSLILFCGKLYPIGVNLDENCPDAVGLDFENPYAEFSPKDKGSWLYARPKCEFGQEHPDALRLNRSLAPVILLQQDGCCRGIDDSYATFAVLNPQLSLFRFPVNAAQVYQSLMGFIAPQDPDAPPTGDKYRKLAQGFDNGSFRREPGGPTRKRRNSKLAAAGPSEASGAWTLVEMLVVVSILGIIVGIAGAVLKDSYSKSQAASSDAKAKVCNEAIFRARDLNDDKNPAIQRD